MRLSCAGCRMKGMSRAFYTLRTIDCCRTVAEHVTTPFHRAEFTAMRGAIDARRRFERIQALFAAAVAGGSLEGLPREADRTLRRLADRAIVIPSRVLELTFRPGFIPNSDDGLFATIQQVERDVGVALRPLRVGSA